MASKPKNTPQDLPPSGGYRPIQFERVHLRRIMNPWLACGLTIAATSVGYIGFFFNYRNMRRDEVEIRSSQLAVMPILWAERDRQMLKQVRKNRDEEATLMQDYPGWVVGTYFGEPIYNYLKPEQFVEQTPEEYIVHADSRYCTEKYWRQAWL